MNFGDLRRPESLARWARALTIVAALAISVVAVLDASTLLGRAPVGAMSTGVVARDPLLRDLEALHTYDFVQELRCCGSSGWLRYSQDLEPGAGERVDVRLTRAGDRLQRSIAPETWTLDRLALGFGPPFVAGWILIATALVLALPAARDNSLVPVVLLTGVLGFQQLTALDVNWVHRFERLHIALLTLVPAILLHLALVFPTPTRLYQEIEDVVSPIYTLTVVALVLEQILFGIYQERWILFSRIRELSTLMIGGVLLARIASSLARTAEPLDRYRARILTYGIAFAVGVPVLSFAVDLAAPSNLVGAVLPFSYAGVGISLGLAVGRSDLLALEERYRRLLVPASVTAVSTLALFLVLLGVFRALGLERPLERPSFAVALVALLALGLEGLRRLATAGFEHLAPSAESRFRRFLASIAAADPVASGPVATSEFICEFVLRELDPSYVALVSRSASGRLRPVCAVGEVPVEIRELDLSSSSETVSRLLTSTTYAAGPDLDPETRGHWMRSGLGSVELALPVQAGASPGAVLLIGGRRTGFDRSEIDLLDLMAQTAAFTLQQAQRLGALDRDLRARSSDLARALEHVRGSDDSPPLIPDDDSRFAWVGKLASGIAHEANKPLYVIEHHLSRLRRDPHTDTTRIGAIETELARVRRLIGDLQAYARSHSGDLRSQAVDTFLKDAVADAPVGLSIATRGALTTLVRMDPALGTRLFAALFQNASEAGARSVDVSVESEQSTARIRVRDDGPGIPAELATQVFEPFFSTHRVESATGLGLAIAREVARAHGGSLELIPSEQGAAFELRLPCEPESSARPLEQRR